MSSVFEPYYAVIFTSKRTEHDVAYDKMNDATFEEVKKISGYLGAESYRNDDGQGVTIAKFKTVEDILKWKNNPLHVQAQELGRTQWYSFYNIKICRVEREYEFNK